MIAESTSTEVGSYFIANYPPFSVWDAGYVPEIHRALQRTPDRSVPMGLYIHIPFCRKRCRFCYFRVYTNQNAQAIENYVQALEREFQLLSQQPAVAGRTLAVRVLRRGHSVVSERQAAPLSARPLERISLVANGRRGDLRVRAGDA